MSLIPQNTLYSDVMNAYLGNLSVDQQNTLWQQFMTQNGFTTTPPETAQDETLFVQFVISTLSSEENTVSNSLSPDAIQQKALFSSVFAALIELMNVIQEGYGDQAKSLLFYGNYQQNYTTMIAQVPIYVSDSSSTPHIDTSNLAQWTLGYDAIQMQEVLQSVIAQGQTATSAGFTFDLGLSNPPISPSYFSFQSTPTGLTVSFIAGTTTAASANVSFSPGESNADMLAAAEQAFLSVYNNPFVSSLVLVGNMQIPWSTTYNMPIYLGSDSTQQATAAASAQDRQSVNARNQQFIENLTSYRTILSNQASDIQTTLNSSQQGITSAGNIVQSSIQMLSSICAGIFKTTPI